MNIRAFVAFLICCCIALVACNTTDAQLYNVTALGTLPDHFAASPNDISNTGIVVGHIRLDNSNERHAFVYDVQNGMSLLAGTGDSYAHGISDDGDHIIGRYNGNNFIPASRWDWNGSSYQLTVIGTAQRTTAGLAINNSSQGVGNSFFSQVRGFAHDGSNFVSSALGTSANDINNSGIIVGHSGGAAFITDMNALSPQPIGHLGGGNSDALGVNDLDEVVGSSTIGSGDTHAFYYDGNSMLDLGTLGGNASWANEINIHSQIVGQARFDIALTDTRAFIWQNNTMTDLNTVIDPSSGWNLETASSINDHGQIIGIGTLNGNSGQAFLLTPIPEPNLTIFVVVLFCMLLLIHRRPAYQLARVSD